jgi:hypothetical protein
MADVKAVGQISGPPPTWTLDGLEMVERADAGHVFVIRGDMRTLAADAYLLPTDGNGSVTGAWQWLVGRDASGVRQLSEHCPALVDNSGVVVTGVDGQRVLAVNVGGQARLNTTDGLVRRMSAALGVYSDFLRREVERAQDVEPKVRILRARPLLAMPLVGVRHGGLGGQTGEVIAALLKLLAAPRGSGTVAAVPFDIVIVCNRDSDYAAIQHARRSLDTGTTESWLTDVLAHSTSGKLGVMFGAGASAVLGIPLWNGLITKLAVQFGMTESDARALERLDPIDAATVLVDRAGGSEPFMDALRPLVTTKVHSLTHGLLANLKPALAVTTNYDHGYELALAGMGIEDVAVLPWSHPQDAESTCVLKLHGDATRGLVVLSRDDFVAMQAYRRPLSGVLQESLMVGHILAVGSSMSDPTLVHAAEEVTALVRQVDRQTGANRGPCGTVILTNNDSGRTELLRRSFTVAVADADADAEDVRTLEAARRVDIVLDWLAMRSTSDLSFMLDPIYKALVDGPDKEIAELLSGFSLSYHAIPKERRSASPLAQDVNDFLVRLGIPR